MHKLNGYGSNSLLRIQDFRNEGAVPVPDFFYKSLYQTNINFHVGGRIDSPGLWLLNSFVGTPYPSNKFFIYSTENLEGSS